MFNRQVTDGVILSEQNGWNLQQQEEPSQDSEEFIITLPTQAAFLPNLMRPKKCEDSQKVDQEVKNAKKRQSTPVI